MENTSISEPLLLSHWRFQDDGGDNEERNIYIPYTTRQLIEKSNDKVDQIIVSFRKELGHAGALALEKSLKNYFKEKNPLLQAIQTECTFKT